VVHFIKKKHVNLTSFMCSSGKRCTAYLVCQLSSPNLCYWVDDYWLETDLRHSIPARYQPFSNNIHVCKVYSDWLIKSCARYSN